MPHSEPAYAKIAASLVVKGWQVKIPPEATIAPEKLTHYLLIARPKNDKSGYLARAGFSIQNPDALESAIRQLISEQEAVLDRQDGYGDFYVVEGELTGPDGTLDVITVWITQPELNDEFRFVTLKPGAKHDDQT